MIKSKDKKTNPLDQVTKRIEKYIETYDNPLVHDPLTNSFKTENQMKLEAEIKEQKPKKVEQPFVKLKKKNQIIRTPMNLNLNFQKIEKEDDKTLERLERDSNKNHKILKFPILRASVKAYKNNLNTHKSYKAFRDKRFQLRDKNRKIRGLDLTETLKNYAQTGSEYTKILNQIITQNRLTDFEPVKLVGSVKQIELSS